MTEEKPIKEIHNWLVVRFCRFSLNGTIDGKNKKTSYIVSFKDGIVTTFSGSRYKLMEPDEDMEDYYKTEMDSTPIKQVEYAVEFNSRYVEGEENNDFD